LSPSAKTVSLPQNHVAFFVYQIKIVEALLDFTARMCLVVLDETKLGIYLQENI